MAHPTLADITHSTLDVAIIGGGINGACLFHELTTAGYRVALADRGDFGAGTSQASTMLIWGGLLYMKDWELRTVWSLSASRDRLVRDQPTQIQPRTIRFVPVRGGRSRALVQTALNAYWCLGLGRRARPRWERLFSERAMLNHGGPRGALAYEEAALDTSDARFVLSWILGAPGADSAALNYCAVESAEYHASHRLWRLQLCDTLTHTRGHINARVVVNAAGGWTDEINRGTGIDSPYRHVLSRGVSLSVPRDPRHTTHLAFETPDGNAMTWVPWGPVAMWASTDTVHADMTTATQIAPDDIRSLLHQLNAHVVTPFTPADIVSLRCGVRPIAVPRHTVIDEHSHSLSRHHRIHANTDRGWISVYGGKLSGCTTLAREVRSHITDAIGRRTGPWLGAATPPNVAAPPTEPFPGLDQPHVSPAWSAAHERCRTLDDYLRRRTNIAQWVRRSGLGRHHEHLDHLHHIATTIHDGDTAAAALDVMRCRERADAEWRLIEGVSL